MAAVLGNGKHRRFEQAGLTRVEALKDGRSSEQASKRISDCITTKPRLTRDPLH
tara:strand:+ start:13806 stop:13967 length:162 start_codon:yes stop_codon:yes gene_type:complete